MTNFTGKDCKLLINGRLSSISECKFADFHGNSIFTTLRTHAGKPCFFDEHWQRMIDHAAFFRYALPDKALILSQLLAEKDAVHGRCGQRLSSGRLGGDASNRRIYIQRLFGIEIRDLYPELALRVLRGKASARGSVIPSR